MPRSRININPPYDEPIPTHVYSDRDWLMNHKEELIEQYGHCFILVYHERVLGTGKTWEETLQEAERNLPPNIGDIYLEVERLGPSPVVTSGKHTQNLFIRYSYFLLFGLVVVGFAIILWLRNPVSGIFVLKNGTHFNWCGVSIYRGYGGVNPPLVAHNETFSETGISGIRIYAGLKRPDEDPIASFQFKGTPIRIYYPGEIQPDGEIDTTITWESNTHIRVSISGPQVREDSPPAQQFRLSYAGRLDITYEGTDPSILHPEHITGLPRLNFGEESIFLMQPGVYIAKVEPCMRYDTDVEYAGSPSLPYEFEVIYGQISGLTIIAGEPEQ
jgi:hypothetical protein